LISGDPFGKREGAEWCVRRATFVHHGLIHCRNPYPCDVVSLVGRVVSQLLTINPHPAYWRTVPLPHLQNILIRSSLVITVLQWLWHVKYSIIAGFVNVFPVGDSLHSWLIHSYSIMYAMFQPPRAPISADNPHQTRSDNKQRANLAAYTKSLANLQHDISVLVQTEQKKTAESSHSALTPQLAHTASTDAHNLSASTQSLDQTNTSSTTTSPSLSRCSSSPSLINVSNSAVHQSSLGATGG